MRDNPPAYVKHIKKAPKTDRTNLLEIQANITYKEAQKSPAGSQEKLFMLRRATAYGWAARLQDKAFMEKEIRFSKSNIDRLQIISNVTRAFKHWEDELKRQILFDSIFMAWTHLSKKDKKELIKIFELPDELIDYTQQEFKERVLDFRDEIQDAIGKYLWTLFIYKGEKIQDDVDRYAVYWITAKDEGMADLASIFYKPATTWPLLYPKWWKEIPREAPPPTPPVPEEIPPPERMRVPPPPEEEIPEREPIPPPKPTPPPIPEIEASPEDVAIRNKLKDIHSLVGEYFIFTDLMELDIFIATFLIRNGSCVLKGAPGTGKTTLIEMATMLFANDYQYEYPDHSAISRKSLVSWLIKRGIYGVTAHNADKEPDDVYFFTDVRLEKRARPYVYEHENETMTEEVEIEEIEANPLRRPNKAAYTTEMQKLGFPEHPDIIEDFEFRPKPREIVNSIIKLHNEANRMNANVADATLKLLAENEVEYRGKLFQSPSKVDARGNSLNIELPGQVSFFDYNPHLDVEGMELDRALLDRITLGIYLSGGDVGMRFKVLYGKEKKAGVEPRQAIVNAINSREVLAISKQELFTVWDLIEKIPIDVETQAWISLLTNLPNLSIRKYKDTYFKIMDWNAPLDRLRMEKIDKFIDTTIISYKGSKKQMMAIMEPAGEFDYLHAIDAIDRQFGVRSAESLQKLLKAYWYMRASLKGDASILEIRITDKNRWKILSSVLQLLPYVLDHRINIGVGPDIMQNFLNAKDFLKNWFVSKYAIDRLLDDNKANNWMVLMKSLMAVWGKRSRLMTKEKRKTAFIKEYVSRTDLGTPNEGKRSLMDDPFRNQFLMMAETGFDI